MAMWHQESLRNQRPERARAGCAMGYFVVAHASKPQYSDNNAVTRGTFCNSPYKASGRGRPMPQAGEDARAPATSSLPMLRGRSPRVTTK
jgi:hypothetical protein